MTPEAINQQKVLAGVAKFYREALRRDKAGQELARALGLHDSGLLDRWQVGYANGALLGAIPTKGGVRDFLREISLINEKNQEATTGSLMIPALDQQDNVLGFAAVGRDRTEKRSPARLPLYAFNREAFTEQAVIFTASILEMLRLAQADAPNAVPVGPELSAEDRAFIERHKPAKAYFAAELPDLLRFLQKLEVPCFRLKATFPATPAQTEQALKAAEPIGQTLAPDAVVKVSDDAIRFECGARKYELRELSPGETDRLRVRLKAESEGRFHLDTLDLYAGRSRAAFARSAAPVLGVSDTAIEGDLCLMIRKLEAMRAARKATAGASDGRYVMTPDEEAEAREFLKQPDLLARVVRDLEHMGYVGEEANKKIAYLITISRKLDNPLCGVIISRAGAGKSRLMESLAELVPPEDVVSYTRITPQALYYAENRSFKHKLMIAGEDEGLMGSDYAMRELISSKRISLAAPVKDTATGKMKIVEYEVEGPIALMFSTTQPAIHYENATRCFMLSLDESREQTERVLTFQRERKTLEGLMRSLEGRALRRVHRNAQRLLKPLLVVNPYAAGLKFASARIESRRDNEKYLSLIEAIAFLKQHQREVKRLPCEDRELEYIEVTREDIAEADKLMGEAVGDQGDELSRTSRKLLDLIAEMVQKKARELEIEPRAVQFNRRDIREHTGWSDNQIKAHIKRIEELELLTVKAGEQGRMYRYSLGSWEVVGEKLGADVVRDCAENIDERLAVVGKLAVSGKGV
jgi:DNA-binding MarR family transcriptional regulator